MKKFVCLCTLAAVLFTLTAAVCATGATNANSSVSGSGEAMISEQLAPTDDSGTPFDAGNNARTGDVQNNGGMQDGTAGGTSNGTNPGNEAAAASETGTTDSGSNPPAANSPSGGTSWFAVIIAIFIVAAIIALVVALLPKQRSM